MVAPVALAEHGVHALFCAGYQLGEPLRAVAAGERLPKLSRTVLHAADYERLGVYLERVVTVKLHK